MLALPRIRVPTPPLCDSEWKVNVIAYYFFAASLLSHDRWIAGCLSFCLYRPAARIVSAIWALCRSNSLDTSTLCCFKTDNQYGGVVQQAKRLKKNKKNRKKQKRRKPDKRDRAIFEQTVHKSWLKLPLKSSESFLAGSASRATYVCLAVMYKNSPLEGKLLWVNSSWRNRRIILA